MNKIDVIQPTPRKACVCFGATCLYCKHEVPHPSPEHLTMSSEYWDEEKAKAREQKSLIDFDPPKLDSDKQTTNLVTDERKVMLVDDIPFQKLTIQQDRPKEELPEVTDALVPPPEASAATPAMEVAKPDEILEENNEGLTEHRDCRERNTNMP